MCHFRAIVVAWITLGLLAIVLPQAARAGFVLGDAANFAVLYEGNGQSLQFNNSNITGNIGIGAVDGATGHFQGNGPGTITGNIEFYAANSGQFSNSGVTITGTVSYNNPNVDPDLVNLNALSQNLSLESGTALAISTGGSVNASSGTLDGSGNRVFTVSSVSFPNGTFTITGASTDYVVINVPHLGGGPAFNGSIVLAGGITSDHVLFNLDAGDYATLSGGDTLTISTNGATTTGTFLDPNGNIQINHSLLDGRLFGGDTQNMAIVSGANIVAPSSTVPEPSHTVFALGLMMALALAARKKFIRS
jgi:hypothetical protein